MITTQKQRYNKGFNESVLFFPQMRPEKKEVKLTQGIEDKELETLYHLIEKNQDENNKISLFEIKEKSGLSGKKWDKLSKQLVENKMIKISKENNSLIIENIYWSFENPDGTGLTDKF